MLGSRAPATWTRDAEGRTLELRGQLEIALEQKASAEARVSFGEQAQLIEWQKGKLSEMSKEMHDLRTMYTSEHYELRVAQKSLAKRCDERTTLTTALEQTSRELTAMRDGRAADVVEHERLTRVLFNCTNEREKLQDQINRIFHIVEES